MLLDAIGSRLRARRKQLDLTQAELAARAGVSPRFLVQLESGRGNISVQRLAEVCTVLALPLEQLFAGLGPAAPARLALVGLRGAGKSTVGAAVASALDVPFVELDARVEETAGMTLGEVFELGGEARYRALEREVLDDLLDGGGAFVLAAGGSLVTAAETWARLRSGARTAWLQAAPASHLERVRAQGDLRPMRGRPDALGELRAILEARAPLYAQADLHLDTDALGVDGSVDRLVHALSETP